MRSRSVVSMLCRRKTSSSLGPKSPPTTDTKRTSVKKLAAIEKCDAEPPSIRGLWPKGVSTASKATEPTTSNDINDLGIPSLRSFSICHLTFFICDLNARGFHLHVGPTG